MKQHLTEVELRRRQVTETLTSSSLAKNAIDMLTLRNAELQAEAVQRELLALRAGGGNAADRKSSPKVSQAQLLGLPNDSLLFDISCDSRHYELPRTVLVPIPKISTSSSLSGDRGTSTLYSIPSTHVQYLYTTNIQTFEFEFEFCIAL